MNKLALVQSQASYVGTFAKPLLGVWGMGQPVLQAIFDAFSPLGVSLADIRLEEASRSPADQAIVVQFANWATYRWRLERVELTLFNFSEEQLRDLARILHASDLWVKRMAGDFSFSSHQFSYFGHSTIEGMNSREFLARLPHVQLRTSGDDLGAGMIFHWLDETKRLSTSLLVDHSQVVPLGLFTMFSAVLTVSELDYMNVIIELRGGFSDLLAQLGLEVGGA